MEDDMDELPPQSVEAESVKSIIRGEFGGSAGDVSLKF